MFAFWDQKTTGSNSVTVESSSYCRLNCFFSAFLYLSHSLILSPSLSLSLSHFIRFASNYKFEFEMNATTKQMTKIRKYKKTCFYSTRRGVLFTWSSLLPL
jgi:hypothetical protein